MLLPLLLALSPAPGPVITNGPVVAVLENRRKPMPDGMDEVQPVATVRLRGQVVGQLVGALRIGSGNSDAVLQVLELDPANPYPEVLLSTFTGGAHCCNDTRVLTSSPDGRRWFEVRRDPVNGGPNGASDPLGNGRDLLVDVDNRFLYQFASYAGSSAPSQIWQLNGPRFVDISHRPELRPLHRRRLQEMESWFKQPAGQRTEANGFLAAWVATKALVGDFDSGWRRMLGFYDRRSDWGLTSCEAGYNAKGDCRRPEKRYADFPAALWAFLRRTGYLPAQPQEQPGPHFSPETSWSGSPGPGR